MQFTYLCFKCPCLPKVETDAKDGELSALQDYVITLFPFYDFLYCNLHSNYLSVSKIQLRHFRSITFCAVSCITNEHIVELVANI